ncbi:MAG: hypothetical protein QXD03_04485 [Candidatus Anstonellales archaeon]
MVNNIESLISKLKVLGYVVVEYTDGYMVCDKDGRYKLYKRDGDDIKVSLEYDYIRHIDGSDVSIVKKDKHYRLLYGTDRLSEEKYTNLSKEHRTNSGYNIVANLGYYVGLIDDKFNDKIPFVNMDIGVFKSSGYEWVYLCRQVDCVTIHDVNGNRLKVSEYVTNKMCILCEGCVVIGVYNGSSIKYVVRDYEGNLVCDNIDKIVYEKDNRVLAYDDKSNFLLQLSILKEIY